MHPADIKAALQKAGYTQTRLAKEIGRSPYHVCIVIQGNRVSDYVQRQIARAIGLAPEKVFPDRYKKQAA
jgi:lambda repressor-like predicted transcriptional regulator